MKILLAVSGGIDSMYLASRSSDFFPGSEFGVAHCNFHLRGEESDGDEAFVRNWAATNDIPFYKIDFDTSAYATANGISIEMAARELRYQWFSDICRTEGFDAIAVAHNANDNAETLFLNLLRGTGSRGLCGMSFDSYLPGNESCIMLRPLLDISRKEIETWMRDNGKEWREDHTNAENLCKRNILRNKVFPLLEEINPSYLRTLSKDMKHFSQTEDIVNEFYLSKICEIEGDGEDGPSLNLKKLLSTRHWRYILWRWLEPYGLSEETFGKLVALLQSDRTISGKQFESPTHIVFIHKKGLFTKKR